jgi:glyoxalase superfamily protein
MPVTLNSVVFSTADPVALADFWTVNVEDWKTVPGSGGEVRLRPSEEDGSTVELVFSPARVAKTRKNRIHIDVNSAGYNYRGQVEAYSLIGAQRVDIGQGELVPWTVFADPEGNEFCLLKRTDRYENTGRLAAIVVDCADPAVLATFWSAATGWPITDQDSSFAAVQAMNRLGGCGPFLEFSRVADRSDESRLQLGMESYWAHQHDADVAELCKLGATRVRTVDGAVSYTVLADPEGNEFRLVIPAWPPTVGNMG